MESPLRHFKANIFQALAHPTRIAIVDELRDGEVSSSTLLTRLNLAPANLSQHLALLRERGVVTRRKVGSSAYYSLSSPVLTELLDVLKRYFNRHLKNSIAMLRDEAVVKVRRR
jgi:DNA-binding transcriptional ArsR family regulator